VAEEPIIRVDALDVRYGSSQALFGVSLELPEGGMVSLLGANGAGKSTLARALSGLVPVSAGTVTFAGHDITSWSSHRRRRAGLASIPEGRGIFPGLSVIENLRMSVRQAGGRREREDAIARAVELFPVLGGRRQQQAGSLSGGEQQMLALAGALAVSPRLVIADEMSLGLAPLVVDAVFERLVAARASGIAVLLIEQFIHRALSLADTCVILNRGTVSWSGTAAEAGPDVLDHYLGAASVPVSAPARAAAGSSVGTRSGTGSSPR
jgi:branched-chain amino acid transport system ATP-binding protein